MHADKRRCPINKSAFISVYLRLIIFFNFFSAIRYWGLHSLNFGFKQITVCRTLPIYREFNREERVVHQSEIVNGNKRVRVIISAKREVICTCIVSCGVLKRV